MSADCQKPIRRCIIQCVIFKLPLISSLRLDKSAKLFEFHIYSSLTRPPFFVDKKKHNSLLIGIVSGYHLHNINMYNGRQMLSI